MTSLKNLLNESRKEKGEKEKRPYGEPGRDGERRIVEHYGHKAIASFRNNAAGVVEFFESMKPAANMLNDPVHGNARAEKHSLAIDAGIRRTRVARDYREVKEAAASPTAMRSADWEFVGAPGFGPKDYPDGAWSALKQVVYLERNIPPLVLKRLHSCFVADKFEFDLPTKYAREMVLEELRLGLDIISVEKSEMNFRDFCERWPWVLIYQ